jgi:hypothetical protein
MVEVTISEGNLVLHVRGADQLWAFKSTLEVPLHHVTAIRYDPEIARGAWHGIRLLGTNLPGVLTAGRFYQHGKLVFWDVHDPAKTVVIDLRDERFSALIVEVADPQSTVALVQPALPLRGPHC